MIGLDDTRRHDLQLVTWAGSVATALFLVVSWLTTQVESIRAALPFTEDPFDAVVSFAVVGITVVGGATLVRAIGHLRRPYDPLVARRIAIGAALATLIVAVAVTSDLAAMTAVGVAFGDAGVAAALALLVLTTAAMAVALVCIWRARSAFLDAPVGPAREPEPDIIDEIGSIVESIGAARAADGLAGWVERSPLSPRRHRFVVGLLGGAAAGVAVVVWHAIREGPWGSPVAAAVFGILMALGVAGAYILCLAPLRLLRTPRRD